MRPHSNRFNASTWLALFTLAVGSPAIGEPANLPTGYKLLYDQKCNQAAALKDFVLTDPGAWRFSKDDSGPALELFQQSDYSPAVRSPLNIALIADKIFGDFIFLFEFGVF